MKHVQFVWTTMWMVRSYAFCPVVMVSISFLNSLFRPTNLFFSLCTSSVYHLKCIDPWLTKNRRVCPVCKGKVVLPGFPDPSDSESEADHQNTINERTPLVRSSRVSRWRRNRSSRPNNESTNPASEQQQSDDVPDGNTAPVSVSAPEISDSNFPVTSGHFSVNCDERENGTSGSHIESSTSSTVAAVIEVEPENIVALPPPPAARRSSRRNRNRDAIV